MRDENFNIKPNVLRPDEFIFLKIKRDTKIKVYISEIIYCEADSSYTIIHLLNGKNYIVSFSLKVVEGFLSKYSFIRSNRSSIINPQYIEIINNQRKPSIELINKIKLDVSKTKIKEIEQFLDEKYNCFTN